MITDVKLEKLRCGVFKLSWLKDGEYKDHFFYSLSNIVKVVNHKKTLPELRRSLKEWLETTI